MFKLAKVAMLMVIMRRLVMLLIKMLLYHLIFVFTKEAMMTVLSRHLMTWCPGRLLMKSPRDQYAENPHTMAMHFCFSLNVHARIHLSTTFALDRIILPTHHPATHSTIQSNQLTAISTAHYPTPIRSILAAFESTLA